MIGCLPFCCQTMSTSETPQTTHPGQARYAGMNDLFFFYQYREIISACGKALWCCRSLCNLLAHQARIRGTIVASCSLLLGKDLFVVRPFGSVMLAVQASKFAFWLNLAYCSPKTRQQPPSNAKIQAGKSAHNPLQNAVLWSHFLLLTCKGNRHN